MPGTSPCSLPRVIRHGSCSARLSPASSDSRGTRHDRRGRPGGGGSTSVEVSCGGWSRAASVPRMRDQLRGRREHGPRSPIANVQHGRRGAMALLARVRRRRKWDHIANPG
jgi:hypothetical protein